MQRRTIFLNLADLISSWVFFNKWVVQLSSNQLLSRVRLSATPWIASHQASLSITNSQSSLRLTSIESVMPSSHLILCHPLLLLPPIPPSISLFQWLLKAGLHIYQIIDWHESHSLREVGRSVKQNLHLFGCLAKGSDHELLITKFKLKLKKVGKTAGPFRYGLNQIPYDYTVEAKIDLRA